MDAAKPLPTPAAAAVAAGAYLVPLLLSIGANPAPTNPRILAWYASLRKPAFKPPDVLIPLAWMVVEGSLAVGAYRLLRQPASGARSRALAAWCFNVGMIGAWSRLFFRQQNLGASTVAAAVMVATGATYVVQARQIDRPAATAGIPLVAWVGFATVLTAALWKLNRR